MQCAAVRTYESLTSDPEHHPLAANVWVMIPACKINGLLVYEKENYVTNLLNMEILRVQLTLHLK